MTSAGGVSLRGRLEELYRFERSSMRPGLAGIERLLNRVGRPERLFPSVLIAGTNGKGSTAAHLASILKSAGLRVGLYTSPHLLRFHERIRIGGEEISDEALDRLLERWWPIFEEEHPSFFEAATALCFEYFAEQSLDFAVVEVGLGGRLDSTNILEPRVSVMPRFRAITPNPRPLLRRIATEKAGIIRPGRPLDWASRERSAKSAILECLRPRAWSRWVKQRLPNSWRSPREPSFVSRPSFGRARTPFTAGTRRETRPSPLAAERRSGAARRDDRARNRARDRRNTVAGAGGWIDGDPPILVDVAHNVEGAASLAATLAGFIRPAGGGGGGFLRDKVTDNPPGLGAGGGASISPSSRESGRPRRLTPSRGARGSGRL
jgi:folylpolyglutamate synthase/dihydrofolate synthase